MPVSCGLLFLDFPLHMVTETETAVQLTEKYKLDTDTIIKWPCIPLLGKKLKKHTLTTGPKCHPPFT